MSERTEGRIHSMDALRASTMLLLVPAHAAGLLGANGHPGAWAVAVFWSIHVFRMPLFFAMSGFFLGLLLTRRGFGETLRNRSLRIIAPLLIGLVTVVPLFFAASEVTGVAITDAGMPSEGGAFQFRPAFLWFLWYLLAIDAVAFAAYLVAPGPLSRAGRALRSAIARPFPGILLLAVPTALVLWPQPDWMAIAHADTFALEPWMLAYYSIFFCLGVTLNAHRELIAGLADRAWQWAGCALAATLPAAALFALHDTPTGEHPLVHGAGLLLYALATWASLMALVGLASRYLGDRRPRIRYLADSAYWIYLSHLPAMVLIVALLGTTALGTGPAFGLATVGALAFSLATYPLLVRYTAIGRVLNGRRRRPSKPASAGDRAGLATGAGLPRNPVHGHAANG